MKNLLIIWSELNEMHIPILDEQHRGLASVVNTLHHFMPTSYEEQALQPLLTMVETSWKVHLITEERLLEYTGYPDLAAHKVMHEKIYHDVRLRVREARDTGDPTGLLRCLKEVWVRHINEADLAYVKHVRDYMATHFI